MFVVVEVDSDYDYVEGINFIDAFSTEEEAAQYITDDYKEFVESVSNYDKYLDDFVNSINIPQPDKGWKWVRPEIWKEFVGSFGLSSYLNDNEVSFKYNLKHHLRSSYNNGNEELGYKPRKVPHCKSLRIMEIPGYEVK